MSVTGLLIEYPAPHELSSTDVRQVKRLFRSYGLCLDCGRHSSAEPCAADPLARLDKYSRYNASPKGRERVEAYRGTGKGIMARFRADLNRMRGRHAATLASLGLEPGFDLDQAVEAVWQESAREVREALGAAG